MDDLDRAVSPHHCQLGGRPGYVVVPSDVLGGHHVVSASVRLSGDYSEFRNCGFGICIEQLGPVSDDAPPLLAGPRQEPGHIDEGQQWHVERVAEADEPRALDRSIDV